MIYEQPLILRNTNTNIREDNLPVKNKGGRPSGPKTRCNGNWSDARFNSFIKGGLRRMTMKWAPISQCLRDATTRRGFKMCAGCKQEVPVTVKEEGGRKRIKNVHVDHILPIVDPAVGFTTWDECINRMFCETDNLQVLCSSCHTAKTEEEKQIAKQRREREKNGQ